MLTLLASWKSPAVVRAAAAQDPAAMALFYDAALPQARFAAAEIRRADVLRAGGMAEYPLSAWKNGVSPTSLLLIPAGEADQLAARFSIAAPKFLSEQSYALRRITQEGRTILLAFGGDAAGMIYAGLDLAEAIRLGTLHQLADSDHAPFVEKRGIKFNIPLDVRTPSYSDNSHAAQANIPEMWSFDFWQRFLDEMARNRFNVLSLWNLHPFPSLVRVPEYPEVALRDVRRTRVAMDDTYSHNGNDMVRPELLRDTEVLRRMDIGEKVRFWRDVMQYAQDRGIEVYWFTWNIFTFGAEGKYGIDSRQDNPRTIDYFRASVREMVLTYPLLAGFGITAGEHMENRTDAYSKEKWLYATYGRGIADALQRQPGRKVRLIHRYHMTGHQEILREWKDFPGPLDLSFKYSIAHMYSIPDPPFLQPVLPFLSPALRTWLTVRDDDYYSFRWGDPAFARAYLRHMPGKDKLAGFYMGPDGTVWGRDFLDRKDGMERPLVAEKRWYALMLWGRLSYEPDLPDELFQRSIAARFPAADSASLMRAWAEASRLFPQITRFFWGDIDLRWFPEACLSHPRYRGFYTVRDFITGETMPGSGLANILQWRDQTLAQKPVASGPLQVAEILAADASSVLKKTTELQAAEGGTDEYYATIGDLTAMAHLGNYYAAKIRGAAELALFDKTGAAANREAAIRHLRSALVHWKLYAAAYTRQYRQPWLYNRVGWVDIPALTAKVEQDIIMAMMWAPGTLPDKTPPAPSDTPFRK